MKVDFRSSRVLLWTLSIGIVCSPSWGAASLTITANGGNLTDTKTVANCRNLADTVLAPTCYDTAFISNQLATSTSEFLSKNTFNGTAPTTQTFTTAFDTWKAANAGWTLANGGLLDIAINVTKFVANAPNTIYVGGMEIQADLTLNNGYTGPTLAQLVWTQGLYINYQPGNAATTPAAPANTLDTYSFSGGTEDLNKPEGPFTRDCTPIPASGATTPSDIPNNIVGGAAQRSYCGPIYPFQGAAAPGKSFYDAPRGLWETPASFRGIALLSSVNTVTKTLTVYENGINYGFDLKTPEPGYFVPLLLLGSIALWKRHRRGGAS